MKAAAKTTETSSKSKENTVNIDTTKYQTRHYMTYYTWVDLFMFILATGAFLYVMMAAFLVPTREFLLDMLVAETAVV